MHQKVLDWNSVRQLSIIQLLLAVFLPSAFAFMGFHVVLPALVAGGTPVMIAWPSVASVMLFILVSLAVFLLSREAKGMGTALAARMCFRAVPWKQWILYIAIIVVGVAASYGIQRTVLPLMHAVGFTVPDYMPFFLNPAIDASKADPSVLSPGLPLHGQYGLLVLIAVTLLLNILAEELYFRAFLLPKLSRHGEWSWVLNGTLFALYHTFQLWLLPTLLVASLFFAFLFYRSKSIWPSLVGHLVGNFIISILGIVLFVTK